MSEFAASKRADLGLLLLRLGVGALYMIVHGWPKISGGPERWERYGGAMANLGLDFLPTFWGFAAAFSEFFGGLLLLLGFLFRPACTLLFVTMLVATSSHLFRGDGLGGAAHALKMAFVFLGLLLTGPGLYSLDAKLFGKRPPAA